MLSIIIILRLIFNQYFSFVRHESVSLVGSLNIMLTLTYVRKYENMFLYFYTFNLPKLEDFLIYVLKVLFFSDTRKRPSGQDIITDIQIFKTVHKWVHIYNSCVEYKADNYSNNSLNMSEMPRDA